MHGGATPGGIASPHYKTGRYSKYLPTNLAERYATALADPNALELNDEIALIDARLSELTQSLGTGESGDGWREAREVVGELRRAETDARREELFARFDELEMGATRERERWEEIGALTEQRRKLVETQTKRQAQKQSQVTVEQVQLLLGLIQTVIREGVMKYAESPIARLILNHIASEFVKLNGGPNVGPVIDAAARRD